MASSSQSVKLPDVNNVVYPVVSHPIHQPSEDGYKEHHPSAMAIPNFMNLNIGGHIRIIWDFQLKGPLIIFHSKA